MASIPVPALAVHGGSRADWRSPPAAAGLAARPPLARRSRGYLPPARSVPGGASSFLGGLFGKNRPQQRPTSPASPQDEPSGIWLEGGALAHDAGSCAETAAAVERAHEREGPAADYVRRYPAPEDDYDDTPRATAHDRPHARRGPHPYGTGAQERPPADAALPSHPAGAPTSSGFRLAANRSAATPAAGGGGGGGGAAAADGSARLLAHLRDLALAGSSSDEEAGGHAAWQALDIPSILHSSHHAAALQSLSSTDTDTGAVPDFDDVSSARQAGAAAAATAQPARAKNISPARSLVARAADAANAAPLIGAVAMTTPHDLLVGDEARGMELRRPTRSGGAATAAGGNAGLAAAMVAERADAEAHVVRGGAKHVDAAGKPPHNGGGASSGSGGRVVSSMELLESSRGLLDGARGAEFEQRRRARSSSMNAWAEELRQSTAEVRRPNMGKVRTAGGGGGEGEDHGSGRAASDAIAAAIADAVAFEATGVPRTAPNSNTTSGEWIEGGQGPISSLELLENVRVVLGDDTASVHLRRRALDEPLDEWLQEMKRSILEMRRPVHSLLADDAAGEAADDGAGAAPVDAPVPAAAKPIAPAAAPQAAAAKPVAPVAASSLELLKSVRTVLGKDASELRVRRRGRNEPMEAWLAELRRSVAEVRRPNQGAVRAAAEDADAGGDPAAAAAAADAAAARMVRDVAHAAGEAASDAAAAELSSMARREVWGEQGWPHGAAAKSVDATQELLHWIADQEAEAEHGSPRAPLVP